MKTYYAAAVLSCLPSLLFSQTYQFEDYQVVGRLEADISGDGIVDTALLLDELDNGGAAALLIYLGDAREAPNNPIYVKEFAWMGAMFGTKPSLSINQSGSLEVISQNIAVGRDRWEQVVTIAYRRNAFRVAGLTYSYYDTLDLENIGMCDINYLTGSGVVSFGQEARPVPFDLSVNAVSVSEWSGTLPSICFDRD
ncbi:hypothetical protein [Cochlodiniinecator piscidefendens]|uniref:hypothetical protein n=1 Tax=Cochlodiniinecator piscidefendens TaxID=2715756 RepID=UPI00140A9725|nr:hypothetical protein [Cochlodiniinecator piscidefendens]